MTHRDAAVESVQGLLNAQRKSFQTPQDGPLLSRQFEDCLFALPGIGPDQARLRGQLQAAHWASGFKPRTMPGMHNDLVDPAQMMIRGFHFWRQTRWPGRGGRVRYAHTLFNVYLLRCLELLSMRLWDAGPAGAADRLAQVQTLLNQLWRGAPADQPVLVRDARWLIPLAQSPTTDELAAYFEVAGQIAATLAQADRLEISKATVQMAGGHLRSQLRHYCMQKGVSLQDTSLILNARNSNALDFAMTIQNLVPLLEAYEDAVRSGEPHRRREFASAICQGVSADPELFINRVDLLGACSMIEYLFLRVDDAGRIVHTPMGLRHLQLLREYQARIGPLSKPLYEDIAHFRPVEGDYSPYGVIYGFSSNLTEHMALKTLQPDAESRFSLEDVFAEGEAGAERLAWVSGWRKLPHITAEVQKLFDYPQQFAEDIFAGIERALRSHVAAGMADAPARTGRVFIVPEGNPQADAGAGAAADAAASQIPDLPIRYILSSDRQMVAAHRARADDQAHLLHDRQEGVFMVSYETSGGWTAISKDVLTEVLGAGQDAKIAGLPVEAAAVLRLMCPGLVVLP